MILGVKTIFNMCKKMSEIKEDMNSSSEASHGRSLRPRTAKEIHEKKETTNNTFSWSNSLEEDVIQDIYCQGNAKVADFRPTSLETIYESPRSMTGSSRDIMGVVKLKRQCRFSPFYNPPKFKVKQRKSKAKGLKRVGVKVPSGLTITAEQLDKVLKEISDDENEENKLWISNSSSPWYQKDNVIAADKSSNEMSSLTSDLAGMKMEYDSIDQNCKSLENESTKLINKDLSFINSPMKNEEILEDQIDVDLFCPTPTRKSGVEKSKKNRRRSGRVQILCFSEDVPAMSPSKKFKEIDSSSTIVDVSKINESLNKEREITCNMNGNLSVQPLFPTTGEPLLCMSQNKLEKVFPDAPKGHFPNACLSNSLSSLTSVPPSATSQININCEVPLSDKSFQREIPKNLRKDRKRPRRLSGIRGDLYSKNNFEEPEHLFPGSVSLNVSSIVQAPQFSVLEEKLPSPSSLFSQLQLYSPGSESANQEKFKKNRRRSARLSVDNGKHLGSIWKENIGSECNQEYVDFPKSIEVDTSSTLIKFLPNPVNDGESHKHRNPGNSFPRVENSIDSKRLCTEGSSKLTLLNCNTDNNSPILSGIIDSKGFISKGKKYVTKSSSSQFNLNSFTPFQL